MMKIRSVLATAACMAVTAAAAEKPWLVVNLDNNHYQHQFSDDEMTVPAIEKYIDGYLDRAVTHIFVNPNAMRTFFDSKTMEPVWRAFDEPGAMTDKGWLRRAKLLHDRGIDLYDVLLRRIRRNGSAEGWVSMRMNDTHGVHDPRCCLLSSFWFRRPDLWRVPFSPSKSWPTRGFDYSHKEVRDYHIAAAKEMIERYDCDGFEADWTRFPWHLTPNKEHTQTECLNEVMREIRAAANAAARRRGHPVKVAASVLSSPAASYGFGMDAVTWAKEGLIDVLLVANFFDSADFETPWKEWVEKIRAVNPSVRVIPRIDDGVFKVVHKRIFLQEPEYNAYFERLLTHGCRDFAFFNIFVKKNTPAWKWNFAVEEGVQAAKVRATKRIYPSSYRDTVPRGCPNLRQFPFEMTAPRTVRIEIGSAAGAGEVRVNAAFESTGDLPASLTLNGVAAGTVDTGWNGKWGDPKSGPPMRYARYAFPAHALKDGVNAIGFPVQAGCRAAGCEIEVLPR